MLKTFLKFNVFIFSMLILAFPAMAQNASTALPNAILDKFIIIFDLLVQMVYYGAAIGVFIMLIMIVIKKEFPWKFFFSLIGGVVVFTGIDVIISFFLIN